MSDASASGFNARTVALLVIAGIVAFGAFLFLAAYAPELSSGRDGRAHGLSTSAVGFRGVYELLDATGADVDYVRDETLALPEGLTIVTIDRGLDEERLNFLLERGRHQPTLVVLPKWMTVPSPDGRDRVLSAGTGMGGMAASTLSGFAQISVVTSNMRAGTSLISDSFADQRFTAPEQLQAMVGKNLVSLIRTDGGEAVLAQIDGTEIYILSDPDLLNNLAMADPARAQAAIALLDELNLGRGPYLFELVANGFGGTTNLLTLAFEPPFLALTLCVLAAALLALFQAAYRFGPALREPRAIAFGKRALVDNSAELLRVARREHLSSERYAAITRDAAVAALGNPRRLEGEALDRWLDSFKVEGSPPFSELAAQAERATSRQDILDAARALHKWKRTITHAG